MVSSVSENAYTPEFVAKELLRLLDNKYPEIVRGFYKLDDELSLESIAHSRNWIKAGAEPDEERTARNILKDFRDGSIGKFILDEIQ